MSINIEKEPKGMYDMFRCYEHCRFCQKETNKWHKPTNTPVCEGCAERYQESDLKPKKTP